MHEHTHLEHLTARAPSDRCNVFIIRPPSCSYCIELVLFKSNGAYYNISVAYTPLSSIAEDALEPNNFIDAGTALALVDAGGSFTASVDGNLHHGADEDWYDLEMMSCHSFVVCVRLKRLCVLTGHPVSVPSTCVSCFG